MYIYIYNIINNIISKKPLIFEHSSYLNNYIWVYHFVLTMQKLNLESCIWINQTITNRLLLFFLKTIPGDLRFFSNYFQKGIFRVTWQRLQPLVPFACAFLEVTCETNCTMWRTGYVTVGRPAMVAWAHTQKFISAHAATTSAEPPPHPPPPTHHPPPFHHYTITNTT